MLHHLPFLSIQHIDAADHAADLPGCKNPLRTSSADSDNTQRKAVPAYSLKDPLISWIVGDQSAGSPCYLGRRAVIFMQPNHLCLRHLLKKPFKAARIRSSKTIDRLIRVSNHKQFLSIPVPFLNQTVLKGTDILKLVHQQIFKMGA